jgi:IclR family pca regulon transcriptional regulator
MGKVLLAFLPPDRLVETLRRIEFARRGPNTLASRTALAADLERVRADGLAVNNEELAYGLRSIAAPVRSQSGEVTAAINLAVHRSMVSLEALLANLGPTLKRTAAEISARVGLVEPRR